jgi:hypothetical protein
MNERIVAKSGSFRKASIRCRKLDLSTIPTRRADLPALMAKLSADKSDPSRALMWTIFTAVRTGDTEGATWKQLHGGLEHLNRKDRFVGHRRAEDGSLRCFA